MARFVFPRRTELHTSSMQLTVKLWSNSITTPVVILINADFWQATPPTRRAASSAATSVNTSVAASADVSANTSIAVSAAALTANHANSHPAGDSLTTLLSADNPSSLAALSPIDLFALDYDSSGGNIVTLSPAPPSNPRTTVTSGGAINIVSLLLREGHLRRPLLTMHSRSQLQKQKLQRLRKRQR